MKKDIIVIGSNDFRNGKRVRGYLTRDGKFTTDKKLAHPFMAKEGKKTYKIENVKRDSFEISNCTFESCLSPEELKKLGIVVVVKIKQ
jgi:hypothetical protein